MKTSLRFFLCVIASLPLLGSPAAAQETNLGATLNGLLDYAHKGNPEYAAMRAEVDATTQRIESAGALPDPRFRAELRDVTRQGEQSLMLLPGQVGSTRYLLMQEFPWSGKRDLKRNIAEQDVEAARGRSQGTWIEISSRIKATYARLYLLYRSEKITREIIDLMARLEGVAQARYAGGLAAQQDVIRAQLEQSALHNELIAVEVERRQLKARLNGLLARPAGAPLAMPVALRPMPSPAQLNLSGLEERALARNPQLSTEESRIRAAQLSRDLVLKNRYPDITLGVSPIQYQGTVKEWELMIEMNIPLQQSSRRAQERESEAMLQAAQARKESATWQLLSDLSEKVDAIDAARRTENLVVTQLLPQSEFTYQAALVGYENGKVDFATLLDAQRQIRKARQSQLESQVEAQFRLAEIERIIGEDI
ncbi:TolC family protein [Curvibacter delicatus]|jgi:outer membrane protein TolC|uniref:TolC family protein n=1 Tax=Curvibacter delicatus TaxID=80879 RepID=UPI000835052E|nr:TolC family protein [Curvibacter delicatus]